MKTFLTTYGLTLFAVLGAGIARGLLDPLMGDHLPFTFFFVAIIVAAWLGGLRPALVATLLGLLWSMYFFVPPRLTLVGKAGPHLIGLWMYAGAGLAIATFGEAMRTAQQRYAELVELQAAMSAPAAQGTQGPVPWRGTQPWRRAFFLAFGTTLAALLLGGAVGHANIQQTTANEQLVAYSHQTLGQLETLLSTLKDAETGQRGYLLTQNKRYLRPYQDALRRMESVKAKLKDLVSGHADQQTRLDELEPEIQRLLDELQRTITLAQGGDMAGAMTQVHTDAGKAMMDYIRDRIEVMRETELDLLKRRSEEARLSEQGAVVSNFFTAFFGIALASLAFWTCQRHLSAHQRAVEALVNKLTSPRDSRPDA